MAPSFRERLLGALEAAGLAVKVVITNNRMTMVSVRPSRALRGQRLIDREVKISRRLVPFGDVAIEAVVDYVADREGATERVASLLLSVPHAKPRPAAHRVRRPPLRSRGLHHDLAALTAVEREVHFADLTDVPVTWGRRTKKKRRLNAIRLGSYEPNGAHGPIIRIHPRLDDPRVPGWFIGFVIFHELLHHRLGIRMSPRGDRRELHPPAFREAEAQHPRFANALAWEDANINELLSSDW